MPKARLKVIPLGGLGEIGKNMMVLECDNDIIVIDCGLMFPGEEMLGVDLVIPDISYLLENKDKVRGIVITHGHEDHIGALPYILPRLNVPVYATKLTQGLISVKLKEARALTGADLRTMTVGTQINLGKFRIEFFGVCHSIPDSVGVIIYTPVGTVVDSGDFKLDYTPVDGKPTDLSRLAQIGSQGVLLLLSDSTYAELPGYTPSEKIVGENLDRVIAEAPGRVIITTFASLISRVQQIVDAAEKHGRRVVILGRSMQDTTKMAIELGYLKVPNGLLSRLEELRNFPPDKVVIITTGSQGEPTSALVRITNRDFRQLHIIPGDTVVISASPVPGNESLINRTIDSLFRQGAQVYYGTIAQVHVHGHGSQEELKLLLNLVKPRFFVPVHGEYRHLALHAKLAESVGIPRDHTFVMEDGAVLELTRQGGHVTRRLGLSNVYVDGLSVGDLTNVILRSRRMLSRDGIVVAVVTVDRQTGKLISKPDIVSRGFVDTDEASDMIEASRDEVVRALDHTTVSAEDLNYINTKVKDTLNRFYYEQTKRHPMILPFLVKV
jgi:ribonuclease J